MAGEKSKARKRFLIRYFAVIFLVLGFIALVAPIVVASLTAGDKQTLMSLGGALAGGGLVLLVASFFARNQRS